MTIQSTNTTDHAVWIPAAGGRALVRGMWWGVAAALSGAACWLIYSRLDFRPAAVTNRLVDYALAVAALPLLMVAVLSAIKTLQWLLLAAWPKPVGIHADRRGLTFRLGPFRTRRFDAARLEVRYPFELLEEDDGGDFEAYLPEDQQLARFLPRLRHPQTNELLNRTILTFARNEEPQLAQTLRPLITHWRSERNHTGRSEP